MTTTTHLCPTCGASVPHSERYPAQVCEACHERATDEHGRRLQFTNTSPLGGGFRATVIETGEDHPSHDCWVGEVRCRADEAKFGGIVIEAVGVTCPWCKHVPTRGAAFCADCGMPVLALFSPSETWPAELKEVVAAFQSIAAMHDEQVQRMPDDPTRPEEWDRYWATTMDPDHESFRFHEGFLWPLTDEDVSRLCSVRARTILLAGNGVSSEAKAFAAMGFDAVALDLSPLATRYAALRPFPASRLVEAFGGDEAVARRRQRKNGRIAFVTGDFEDPRTLPERFDAVISRCTVQCTRDILGACRRLIARVSPGGIVILQIHGLRSVRREVEAVLGDAGFVLRDGDAPQTNWTARLMMTSG